MSVVDVERVVFRPVAVPPGSGAAQLFEVATPEGFVFARAEVFVGPEQWGVRLGDRAPDLDDATLLRVVARLLVWHAGCRTETVDVVLGRTHAHHPLVRVGGDYV